MGLARIFVQVAEQDIDGAEPRIVLDLDLKSPLSVSEAQRVALQLADQLVAASYNRAAQASLGMPPRDAGYPPTPVTVPVAAGSRRARGGGGSADGASSGASGSPG